MAGECRPTVDGSPRRTLRARDDRRSCGRPPRRTRVSCASVSVRSRYERTAGASVESTPSGHPRPRSDTMTRWLPAAALIASTALVGCSAVQPDGGPVAPPQASGTARPSGGNIGDGGPGGTQRCVTATPAGSLGPPDGAAGTFYRALVFTNTGTQTCELKGFPGVLRHGRQRPAGRAGRRDGRAPWGRGADHPRKNGVGPAGAGQRRQLRPGRVSPDPGARAPDLPARRHRIIVRPDGGNRVCRAHRRDHSCACRPSPRADLHRPAARSPA